LSPRAATPSAPYARPRSPGSGPGPNGRRGTQVVTSPGQLDLSKRYFVLLGAGSAMGPLQVLLSLGANVIAVDLDRANIW
jgi:hypothetical protein